MGNLSQKLGRYLTLVGGNALLLVSDTAFGSSHAGRSTARRNTRTESSRERP